MKRKKKYDSTGRKMKKVLKAGGGVLLPRGEWERNRPAHLAAIDEKRTSATKRRGMGKGVTEDVARSILIKHGAGASTQDLANEFGLGFRHLDRILKHKFVNRKAGVEALRSLLLENGIQLAAQTRVKAQDMNGMQSAVATGIMVSKFIELDKHQQGKDDDIDIEAISEVGRELKELNDIVRNAGIEPGNQPDEIEDDED